RRGAAERRQLLFQAGAVDRHLARVVHQPVEQVGADAHLFLRRARADVVVVAYAFLHDRRGQRLELDLRRRRRRAGVRLGLPRGGPYRGFGADVELVDQADRHADRAARGDAGDHAVQAVEAALQQRYAVGTEFGALRGHRLEQAFHRVAELADRHDAGHARAALERVQVA